MHCFYCGKWVWHRRVGEYIDVIEVFKDRDVVYVARYSGKEDPDYGYNTWSTNSELPLAPVEEYFSNEFPEGLPNGKIEPWLRMPWEK
jgi:hypothetical protein